MDIKQPHPNDIIEQISDNGETIAIIIRSSYRQDGIRFFTPDDFSQQLAYMNRPAGHSITPHIHCKVNRKVKLTQEVLIIRKGKVQIDFFNDDQRFLHSFVSNAGQLASSPCFHMDIFRILFI